MNLGTNARSERGAVAVIVAMSIVALVGFAAIAVDIGSAWSDRKQLQNGADAGALAVAQDCAAGECGSYNATAQTMAVANKNDLSANGAVTDLDLAQAQVTVRTDSTRVHWFAPVIGIASSNIVAEATAGWGWPSGGSTLPLAYSVCGFKKQAGGWDADGLPEIGSETEIKILISKDAEKVKDTSDANYPCTGPSGNVVPGGFGWLDTTSNTCSAYFSLDDPWVGTDPGASASNGCSPADFESMQNQTVLVPIFDDFKEGGTNSEYHLYGFAAFKITGYNFPGQYEWNCGDDCGGQNRYIKGFFTRFVSLEEGWAFNSGAPHTGVVVVKLIA